MRIATARFFNGCVPAHKRVIVATIARPQSRDFKRWAAWDALGQGKIPSLKNFLKKQRNNLPGEMT
jgi:hypothetical protein